MIDPDNPLRSALEKVLPFFEEACEYIAEHPAEDDRLTAYLRRIDEARAALADPAPSNVQEFLDRQVAPSSEGETVEAVRAAADTMHTGTELLALFYPLLDALRAWRDADGRQPRAIAEAQEAVLTALETFETERALLALRPASPSPKPEHDR